MSVGPESVVCFPRRYGTSSRRRVEMLPLSAPSRLSVPLVATRRNSGSDPEEVSSSAAAGRTSEPPLYLVRSRSSEVTLSLIRFVFPERTCVPPDSY